MQQGIYIAVTLAAIALRCSEPGLPRPFRTPVFALVIAIVLAINLALMAVFVAQDPWNALIGFAIVAGLTLVSAIVPHGSWTADIDLEKT